MSAWRTAIDEQRTNRAASGGGLANGTNRSKQEVENTANRAIWAAVAKETAKGKFRFTHPTIDFKFNRTVPVMFRKTLLIPLMIVLSWVVGFTSTLSTAQTPTREELAKTKQEKSEQAQQCKTLILGALTFKDGSKACFEEFEPFVTKGGARLGVSIFDVMMDKKTFSYAIAAPDSKCIVSTGWAWNYADNRRTDSGAVEGCERIGKEKTDRQSKEKIDNCRCTLLIPADWKVPLTQREFVSQLFKHAYKTLDDIVARYPSYASEVENSRTDYLAKEKLHYQRLFSAIETDERKQGESLARAEEEKRQREALAKKEEDRKHGESLARAEEEKRQREVLAKKEEDRLQRETLALAKEAEVRRQRESLAKAEEDRRQRDELTSAQEEVRKLKEQLASVTSRRETGKSTGVGRKALVIGNDSYVSVPKLSNAVADAVAVGKSLSSIGYAVHVHRNLPEREMKRAIREFTQTVSGGDEVIFFFAGHGVQIAGSNYLLPVDIRAQDAQAVRDESIPLQRVLDDISDTKARLTVAILDACRDNPFAGSGRNIGGRGLTPTSAASGQMILFSAGAGQQALDKVGPADRSPNGLFTRVFLKHLSQKGVTIDRLMKQVRLEVAETAKSIGHDQVPALYDQVIGDFYFNR